MLADTLSIKFYQFIRSELQYLIIFTLLIEKEKLISMVTVYTTLVSCNQIPSIHQYIIVNLTIQFKKLSLIADSI